MPITIRKLHIFTALPLLLAAMSVETRAEDLKVLSAGAMRAALQELAPRFEAKSGHKVAIEYATAAGVEQKVAGDPEIEVAILTKPRIDKLVGQAKVIGGTITPLARAPLGLAVKKGAPKPDISSVDAVKKVLLGAKSVAYADPASGATTGIFLAQAFEKLGIAGELKPKLHPVAAAAAQGSPRVGEIVAKGEAEIGLQPVSELMEVEGVDVVGPLPAELQSPDLIYVAGTPQFTEHPIAAKALIDFLAGPDAKAVYKAKGLQPQ